MAAFLSAHTHIKTIGDDIVVLDTRANAYYCLPGAAAAVSVIGDAIIITDEALAEEFSLAGFLADEAGPPRAAACQPAQDLGARSAQQINLSDITLIGRAWLSMFWAYHGRGFEGLLASAEHSRSGHIHAELTADLVRIVAAFERVLPWLPFQGVCLYRSFLLLRILRMRGYEARWVFGVRTWPFMAHCWLQVGDTALDDTADRLTAFQPILVV